MSEALRLADALHNNTLVYGLRGRDAARVMRQLVAENEQQAAEIERLRVDAERYAYCKTIEGQVEFIRIMRNKGADHLDAAIDAARQA